MWRQRRETVTCIACGETLARIDAREYDKYGDRWKRREKTFEHLCKPCHRELSHQPRQGLETLLVEMKAGSVTAGRFVERYYETVGETTGRTDGTRRDER